MTDENMILQVNHLSVRIRKGKETIPILHDLSFSVREGERWAIAGESGAGKSMTMNALISLLPEGSTLLDGEILYRDENGRWQDILKMRYQDRQAMVSRITAVIFQDSINALNPNERILKQWGQTVSLHNPGLTKEKLAGHLLSRMDIFGIQGGMGTLRQYPDQLSGGMRQRIAIAMALESPARLLIADEPTTSLDAITQRTTVDFIKKLIESGRRTLLYISHNLGILQYMCDHVMIMQNGRIVEQGEAAQVFHRPVHPYTQELISGTMKIMGEGSFEAAWKEDHRL